MLRELLSIFRSDDPLATMGSDFTDMLGLSRDLTLAAGRIYFGHEVSPEERTRLFKQDLKIIRSLAKEMYHADQVE